MKLSPANVGGRRRKTRRGGALGPGECIAKQRLYLKNGEDLSAVVKQYPECADVKYPGGRRRKSKKAGRRTRRR